MAASEEIERQRLEHRIAKLETLLARASRANPATNARLQRVGGQVPQVTGLEKLASPPNAIHLRWEPVNIGDLQYYEVQVAEDATFTVNVRSIRHSSETGFTFPTDNDPSALVTYYFRVRAVNQQGNAGPFSARVNGTSGQVAPADFEVGAAGEIYQFTKSSGFTQLDSNGESETYGPVTVDVFDSHSVVQPRVIFEYDFSSVWSGSNINRIKFELLRRAVGAGSDTVIDSVTVDAKSTIPTSGGGTARAVSPSFSSYDAPGAGDWQYRISVTVEMGGSNSILFRGVNLVMEFIQSKRVI